MLKITLTGGPEFIAAMQKKGPSVLQVLATKLTGLLFQLQAYIVGQKLSGQMLQRRTGILAGSVRVTPATVQGANIVGDIQAGGGAAFYGKFFEIESAGGTGSTKAHAIIATNARALSFIMEPYGRVFMRKVLHPGFSARPFMTSSLTENAIKIQTELQAALDKTIQEP